jgi:ADP-ribose pyrophosphatase YjhB (NUDIX family)
MAEAQFWIGVHGVIAEDGRVLVLRRAPHTVYRPGHWDLPGGHLAVNESIEQCLLREVAEETGLNVEIERMIGLNKAPAGPWVQMLYACRTNRGRGDLRLSPEEHDDARWATVAEIRELDNLIPYLDAVLRRGLLDYLAR